MKKKVVMTFGTFDMFHPGHRYYLSEARKYGDILIVVVALDATVERLKWKTPRESENVRLHNIQQSWLVDEVVLGTSDNHYQIVLDKKPDVLFFGYDQKSFNDERLTKFLKEHNLSPKIIVGHPFEPEKWKSSKL